MAFDEVHGAWLIPSIPITPQVVVPIVFVRRSTDDGRTWSAPVSIPLSAATKFDLDKN